MHEVTACDRIQEEDSEDAREMERKRRTASQVPHCHILYSTRTLKQNVLSTWRCSEGTLFISLIHTRLDMIYRCAQHSLSTFTESCYCSASSVAGCTFSCSLKLATASLCHGKLFVFSKFFISAKFIKWCLGHAVIVRR